MGYTSSQAKEFVKTIGPIIQRVAKERGYKCCSAVIAQAICESAAGTSSLGYRYHNYFGMKCGKYWKGKSVNLSTKEEYTVGTLTTIKDNFRVYDTMEEGVKGYFDFINTTRYANLKTAIDPKTYLTRIKEDGYATSSTYVNTNMGIVDKYGLRIYDTLYEGSKYYAPYKGTTQSVIQALAAVGEIDTSMGHRKMIATANGIQNYCGTEEQNLKLVALLKEGKLLKCSE